MFNGNRTAADGGGVFIARVKDGFARDLLRVGRTLAKRAVRAHRRRVALRELEALDDRILKDIGLSRSLLPYEIERRLIEIEERQTASVRVPTQGTPHESDVIAAAAAEVEPLRRAA